MRTDFSKGKKHDFKLFKDSEVKLSKNVVVMGDSGYTGLKKLHVNSQIPRKSSKKKPLTKKDKKYNLKISKKRICIEHIFGKLKTFKMFSEKYRNKTKRFEMRFNLMCGFYNYQLI